LSVLVDAGDGMNLKLAVIALRIVFDLRLGDVGQAKASKMADLSVATIASVSAAFCKAARVGNVFSGAVSGMA